MHISAFANGYLHCFALAPRAGDSAKVGEIIKGSHSFASLYQKANQTKDNDTGYMLSETWLLI